MKTSMYIMLTGERLKASLLKSGIRQRYPPLPFLFNIVLDDLDRTIRKEKRNKRPPNWKEVKLLLFTNDMTLYLEHPTAHTHTHTC
jgi:hypothetical protein